MLKLKQLWVKYFIIILGKITVDLTDYIVLLNGKLI